MVESNGEKEEGKKMSESGFSGLKMKKEFHRKDAKNAKEKAKP